ncbi:phosphomannomutase [Halostagnicola larsenii XH-48]|uniref:Phosphomannomutase n=1 Tax=Halostagnicola larsenii XH-48 TaxID=797299 RepID=W0JMZ0_9EURY|nr:phosphomannomutase [Halostagnicola larsenii]AHF99958.1 phosphomannomutase [Halostagnicola larsenii XH-48]
MTLFGTAGIRGPVDGTVTPAVALSVGQAAGAPGETFVVGRDGRETGPALAAAMEAGLESAGADVLRLGQVPTPALAFGSRGRRGVMVTASHNPPEDNGIKLFADGVEYDRDAELAIEAAVGSPEPARWDEWGRSADREILDAYRDAVTAYVRERFPTLSDGNDAETATEESRPLEGLSIAVDCGGGVGALATPQILERLGARVAALNATVDGHFSARESKPTPETLTDLSAFLESGSFDLGIGQDGDADRFVVLGPDGDVIHEDTILAVVAAHYTRRAHSSDPVVVTTPNASARIDEQVRTAGGRVERVRLGSLHEGIAREREEGDADTEVVFAAEPWKHIHTRFGGWIDGVASAGIIAALTREAGGTDALREPVTERPYRKVSVDCPEQHKEPAMEALETALPDAFPDAEVDTDYGVRLEFPDASWVLVRPSGTEPYVRIYAESDAVDQLVADAREVVETAIANAD